MLEREELEEEINTAQKPRPPWTARLFFLPVLLKQWVGARVSKLVLPAQDTYKSNPYAGILDNTIQELNSPNTTLSAETFFIATHDGAKLHTLEIKQRDETPIPNQKYIINFIGNGDCYELYLDEMKNDATTLNCNVIGFNFRNVSQSTGKVKSKDDLVTDGIAQVQRLLDLKIDPEHITLKGQSLGSAVATLVAKHFYDNGIKINLFNGRSFSTITNYVVGQVRTVAKFDTDDSFLGKVVDKIINPIIGDKEHTGYSENIYKKILGWVIKPLVKLVLVLLNWEINAAKAYKALPDTHKDYIVVRSSKEDRKNKGNQPTDDGVIVHYASLHKALKKQNRKTKRKLDEAIKNPNIPVNRDARKKFKERKMVASFKKEDAHIVNLSELNCRDQEKVKTANDYFIRFFKTTQSRHEQRKLNSLPKNNKSC